MPFLIEPNIIQLNEQLETLRYKRNTISTNENAGGESDWLDNKEREIRQAIRIATETLARRRVDNNPITTNTWINDSPLYHAVASDFETILDMAEPICPECGIVQESINYSADRREFGTIQLSIINGTQNWDTTDTGDSENYEYRCQNCEEEINVNRPTFFFPAQELRTLQELITNVIAISEIPTINQESNVLQTPDSLLAFITERDRSRNAGMGFQAKVTTGFPVGVQVQKDISRHGPNGPGMRQERSTDARISLTEDFAFRNTSSWKCKHCEYTNEGSKRKCTNKICQKDKFLPVTEIKLT